MSDNLLCIYWGKKKRISIVDKSKELFEPRQRCLVHIVIQERRHTCRYATEDARRNGRVPYHGNCILLILCICEDFTSHLPNQSLSGMYSRGTHTWISVYDDWSSSWPDNAHTRRARPHKISATWTEANIIGESENVGWVGYNGPLWDTCSNAGTRQYLRMTWEEIIVSVVHVCGYMEMLLGLEFVKNFDHSWNLDSFSV